MNEIVTGISMGLGFLWVIWPFREQAMPHRAWIDLALLCLLVYLIIMVRSNMIVSITTYAGLTISAGLRLMSWWHMRKT